VINLSRVMSVLLTAERLDELTASQTRALLGLTFRF
jgi:hypothetical protein